MTSHELLLLSSSVVHGGSYLEYAKNEISEFFVSHRSLIFVPFASHDHSAYTTRVAAAFADMNIAVAGLHTFDDPLAAIEHAGALFVGGGNTFRLLDSMQKLRLNAPIRQRVESGQLRYMGASAGSNLACPTIRTTNDMPIVQPPTFDALGLVPFQINPHYVDPDPDTTHMGETREMRLTEFLQENDVSVLGLREGAWLRRTGNQLMLGGTTGARLLQRGREPVEYDKGADLSHLLATAPKFDSPISA